MYYVSFDVFSSVSLCLNYILLTIVIKIQEKITKTHTQWLQFIFNKSFIIGNSNIIFIYSGKEYFPQYKQILKNTNHNKQHIQ